MFGETQLKKERERPEDGALGTEARQGGSEGQRGRQALPSQHSLFQDRQGSLHRPRRETVPLTQIFALFKQSSFSVHLD